MCELDDVRRQTILDELRHATRAAHDRLEQRLDLLAQPADRDHFIAVLRGFLGFHRGFEPFLSHHGEFAGWLAERSQIAALRADLTALGVDDAAIDDAPVCRAAAELTEDRARTWGALYVIEGSTLGGQVITRHLAGTPWLPAGGLRTFHPYGSQTGHMWNEFRARLVAATTSLDPLDVTGGAVSTFSLLAEWLPTRSMNAQHRT